MKKLKAIFAGLVLACVAAPVAAGEFSFTDYGAGIKGGDKLLSIDASLSWADFSYFGHVFYTPWIYGDLQFAVPLGSIGLPFTFGGWVGANAVMGTSIFALEFAVGGSAAYHVRLPLDNFDLYAGLKLGVAFNIGTNWRLRPFWIDWGFNIGASYFFSSAFGVNLELGYPGFKGGVIFKF